jgi:hypothetical protein
MAIANTTIQIKKSTVSGNTPSSLANGEIAINTADGKLFYRTPSGSIGSIVQASSFATVNANSSLILASSPTDTLSFTNGGGINIIGNTVTKTITHQIVGYSSFLAPFSGTLTAAQIGALVQIGGNVTLPNANSCPSGGTFTFTNETSNQYIVTVGGGGDFIYHNPLLTTSNKSIAINSGETLQIASRGSVEWDCVGGTALLKYTQTTNVNSLVINSGAGGSITFADGTIQYTANAGSSGTTDTVARTLAQNAYNQANAAFVTANNAVANLGPVITVNSAGRLYVANTTATTSNSTGALTIAGGLGVAGNLYTTGVTTINNYVVIANTTTSNSATMVYNASLNSIDFIFN